MSKAHALMRDVITRYHREFIGRDQLINYGLKHSEIFNVERLVEESIAHASDGKLQFIDGAHMDYPDGSDCKTASIRVAARTEKSVSHVGEISGVSNAAGNIKAGALRCVIYNPHEDETMFYFLPKDFWQNHVTLHPTSGIGKIVYSYHRTKKSIAKFDGFRLYSFKDLAKAVDTSKS